MDKPTYKELLKLLEQAEAYVGTQLSTAEFLMAKSSELYPGIKVSRPGRFLETVWRINAPIKSGKLQVDEQSLYLEREWIPRICNPSKG